jgi:hypothetical protein
MERSSEAGNRNALRKIECELRVDFTLDAPRGIGGNIPQSESAIIIA